MLKSTQLRGGVYGLLLGDAAGVPYEFQSPGVLARHAAAIDMTPPPGFARTYSVPVGTWSDDGALMLCLLESLVESGRFDLDDQARRMVDWLDRGHLAVDGHVFDVGITTRQALGRARRLMAEGRSPAGRGEAHEQSAGNGTLMRILPLALWHDGPDAELARMAMEHSALTHAHPACQVACAVYCLWVRSLAAAGADPFADAMARIADLVAGDPTLAAALDRIEQARSTPPAGTGYVVDTLHSARAVLAAGTDFRDVIRRAILLGHDTDTTAAVAGGLAGVKFGVAALPGDWMGLLRGRELVEAILSRWGRASPGPAIAAKVSAP